MVKYGKLQKKQQQQKTQHQLSFIPYLKMK